MNDLRIRSLSFTRYDYYGLTYNSRKAKLDARLQMLSLKYERIQGEVGWRKQVHARLSKRIDTREGLSGCILTNRLVFQKEEFLDNELNSQSENPWRERDEEEQKNLKVELGQLCERQNVSLKMLINSVPIEMQIHSGKMR